MAANAQDSKSLYPGEVGENYLASCRAKRGTKRQFNASALFTFSVW